MIALISNSAIIFFAIASSLTLTSNTTSQSINQSMSNTTSQSINHSTCNIASQSINQSTQPTRTAIEVDSTQVELVKYRHSDQNNISFLLTNIVFLNRCQNRETFNPGGPEDSRGNLSSILNQTASFDEYPYGDVSWDQVVAETKDIFLPFNIEVTDVDPCGGVTTGCTIKHFEAIICDGYPDEFGFGSNAGGVAPFTCSGAIDNAIAFVFPRVWGNDVRTIAETVVHELGHPWGLDHLFDCRDPMTYLDQNRQQCGNKYFQNIDNRCGEFSERNCDCGQSTQNSYALIDSLFGSGEPTSPLIEITEPQNDAVVPEQFIIRVTVTDDRGVASVKLLIDNRLITTLENPPYVFNAPDNLSQGRHTITIEATNRFGATDFQSVQIVVEPVIDLIELGHPCEANQDCVTGLCGTDGTSSLCSQTCSITDASTCPTDYACLVTNTTDDTGLCWVLHEQDDDDKEDEDEDEDEDTKGWGCHSQNSSLFLYLSLFMYLLYRRKHVFSTRQS